MIQTLEKTHQSDVSPLRIYELAFGFAVTKTMLVAQKLGIFQTLAKEGKTAAQIATEKKLDEPSLEKLLNSSVSLGLLQKQKGVYTNSALSERYLVPGVRGYLGRFLDHFDDLMYPVWGHLDSAIQSGKSQVVKVIGKSQDQFFQALDHDEDALVTFMATMEQHSLLEGEALANTYDFTPHQRLLDVAGGTGAMSVTIAEKYPHLKMTVFDRPPVIKIANKSIKEHGLSERIQTQAGSFFTDTLPTGADVILLSAILHNWTVPQAEQILRKCHEALPPGGTLLLSDLVLNEEKTQPTLATLCSLNMLVMMDAQEFNEADYQRMFAATGFRLERVQATGGFRQLLIARRL